MLAICLICEVNTRKLSINIPPIKQTVGLSFPELMIWKGNNLAPHTKNGAPIRVCFDCLAEIGSVLAMGLKPYTPEEQAVLDSQGIEELYKVLGHKIKKKP